MWVKCILGSLPCWVPYWNFAAFPAVELSNVGLRQIAQTCFIGATAYISSIEDSDTVFSTQWPIVRLQELTGVKRSLRICQSR